MTDETTTNSEKTKAPEKKKENRSDITKSITRRSSDGRITGSGADRKGFSTRSKIGDEKLSVDPLDPLIKIKCIQPGGVIIHLDNRPSFLLRYGFNSYNLSIWEKIVQSKKYDELISRRIISLNKWA